MRKNHENSNVSYRDMLKFWGVLAFTIGGACVGLSKLGDWLDEINFDSRRDVFNKLMSEKDSREGNEAIIAWLKFNAAEIYAREQRWPLSSATLHHFLYGNGRDFNPSSQMTESLMTLGSNGAKYETGMTELEMWKQYTQSCLNEVFKADKPHAEQLFVTPTKDNIRKSLKHSSPFELKFQGVSAAGNLDFNNSFGHYTVNGQGIIHKSTEINGGWQVFGNNFRVNWTDNYDWDTTHGNVSINFWNIVSDLLTKFGVYDPNTFMINNFGQQAIDLLNKVSVLESREGALLVQKKYANEFHISSDSINISGDTTFFIPTRSLSNFN